MKISCEIIKDLLPLYLDGVCSEDSNSAIGDHLAACEKCETELQAMKNFLTPKTAEQNLNEAEAVKKLSKKWKKGMILSLLKGILITISVLAVSALVSYIFMGVKMI